MFVYLVVDRYIPNILEVYTTRKAANIFAVKHISKYGMMDRVTIEKRKVKHMIFNRIKNGKRTTKNTKRA